jgi:hypothetical protein
MPALKLMGAALIIAGVSRDFLLARRVVPVRQKAGQ